MNPFFPFHIEKIIQLNPVDFVSGNYDCILFLKTGDLFLKSISINKSFVNKISKSSIIFLDNKMINLFKNSSKLDAYIVVYKKQMLNNVIMDNYAKSVYEYFMTNFIKKKDSKEICYYSVDNETAINIELLLNKIIIEYKEKKSGYHLLINNKIIEILIILYRLIESKNQNYLFNDIVKNTINYIKDNFSENINLQLLADRVGVSPSYLSRLFKERIGKTIFEYINHLRIAKASRLLKNSSLSIIEIAYAVGYNNISFFNRYFKKIMSISPREFRNQK